MVLSVQRARWFQVNLSRLSNSLKQSYLIRVRAGMQRENRRSEKCSCKNTLEILKVNKTPSAP